MLLVDRRVTGCAVNLGCGCHQHSRRAQLAGGLQDIQRALDVGVHIGIRRMVAEGDADERRQVKNHIDAFHGGFHAVRIADITAEKLHLPADFLGQPVQPTEGVERVVVDEGANLAAEAGEVLRKVTADETIGTGDENFFVFEIHLGNPQNSPRARLRSWW